LKPVLTKEAMVSEYFWIWPLFALQAGFINSGGFLACSRFVSHVTGFGTTLGTEFLEGDYLIGLEMLLIPVSFILGCSIACYFREFKRDRYQVPFYLISFILLVITVLGSLGHFGTFGEPLKLQRDVLLLSFLCLSCGLQNGVIASMTAGAIRTTHLTGIATDLGLSLTRIIFVKDEHEKFWVHQRILKMILFGLGATMGSILFRKFEFQGFLLPAISNLLLFFFLRSKVES
jgi:uncharacterized membrane protein YoaK (UPF0700 family)